jgi:NAD-dependent deacetylase
VDLQEICKSRINWCCPWQPRTQKGIDPPGSIATIRVVSIDLHLPNSVSQTLAHARRVCVLTGAGISAESGVPTFRDALTGLWERYNPEELATPEAFARNPRLVWEWYAHRRKLVQSAEPNPGHLAIAELEGRIPEFTLITQNVDGLHARAGSRTVIELHGNIMRTRCSRQNRSVTTWEETGEVPPRCPHCQGLLRPDVVWFGEMLPEKAIRAAMEAASACDLLISVGTSGIVYPAAAIPGIARGSGAFTLEINPVETALSSSMDFCLRGPAGEILPALIGRMDRVG